MLFQSIKLLGLYSLAKVAFAGASVTSDPEYALQVSKDGRYFTTNNGEPFFWQADTAWLLFHRLNITEIETYFQDRQEKGFNMVLVTAVTQLGCVIRPEYHRLVTNYVSSLDNANRNGDLPLIDKDFTKPNEPYWETVDQMVEIAWEHGIRIAFVPAWGYHVHLDSMNLPQQSRFKEAG